MRIFLHIGGAKTGTSTIQEFLLQNRQTLSQHGYIYLHMEGRNEYRDLSSYCMNQDCIDDYFKRKFINNSEKRKKFDEEFLTEFQKKMETIPPSTHTVIISSEHLSSRLHAINEVQRLKQLFSNYTSDFKICFYIRNQADKATSSYSTAVKSGYSHSFEHYFKGFLKRYDNNYDQVLRLWENVFAKENITVRLFDRSEFIDGDLLQDFLSTLDGKLANHLNTRISTHNTSLSSNGIFLARYVNKMIPVFNSKKGVSKLNSTLIKLITLYDIGKPIKLNQQQKQTILKNYESSNEMVRLKYFPERDTLFRTK